MRRRRFRLFDPFYGIGSAVFFAAYIGFAVFMVWGQVEGLRETLRLRESGVHTEAVALETRSETWTDSGTTYTDPSTGTVTSTGGSTHTVYYTKVGFTREGEKVVEEIGGQYRKGEKVEVVYDRELRGAVKAASDVDGFGVTGAVFGIVVSLALLVFGVTFAIGWYRNPI